MTAWNCGRFFMPQSGAVRLRSDRQARHQQKAEREARLF
jgi:hypothetical protein